MSHAFSYGKSNVSPIINIFESYKEHLNEDQSESIRKERYICPEIDIDIEGRIFKCLFDTGSMFTAISEQFYEKNVGSFGKYPCLPITNIEAIGFSGERSAKMKKQILCNIKIASIKKRIIFDVIKKLIEDCIFEIDALVKFHVGILIYK